jgi:hypothetical protein
MVACVNGAHLLKVQKEHHTSDKMPVGEIDGESWESVL